MCRALLFVTQRAEPVVRIPSHMLRQSFALMLHQQQQSQQQQSQQHYSTM